MSGRSSNFYFNMKPTMLDAEGAYLIATLVLDSIKGEDVDLVGGLEMGAVPLASAVAVMSHTKGWPLQAFFVRKQAKEHGAKKLIEGLAPDETLARQARRHPGGRHHHRRLVDEGRRGGARPRAATSCASSRSSTGWRARPTASRPPASRSRRC